MSALTGALLTVAVGCNGLGAGVMLSTVIGIVPLTLALPYDRYVHTIQFLWPRYDPFMPITHGITLLADLALVLVSEGPARWLFAVAAGLLAVVMAISVVKNVPVNRYVMALDPRQQPPDWSRVDPRRRWRAWNLLRTCLAVLALVANAAGAAALT
ncbi:DUF1772 domain-containing protein [Actinoplanes sp. RD1]|uniref:DUF1772 domain-containing protein n=1 Tax=Actinoplanes sp. RD1 TaxID=3064538 RepID=UPI00274230E1|nr:DUF1772 domain-containing protein [Actinoplanes sp. RD1]